MSTFITPTQFLNVSSPAQIEELRAKVRKEMEAKSHFKEQDYDDRIEIIIDGEYPKHIREFVKVDLQQSGWSRVTHTTSSENDERPGLTMFTAYFEAEATY